MPWRRKAGRSGAPAQSRAIREQAEGCQLSAFNKPSQANEAAFQRAVDEVAQSARVLIDSLITNAPQRNREQEAARAKERSARRFVKLT